MILDVVGWLALADAVAAVFIAGSVYAVGRRSAHPVPLRAATGLALLLALPAALLYLVVWGLVRLGES